ncbi:MAG: pilus assembly protein TadG [Alphaproteobacteria bacterium]|nr:MAG: pilus assembly protein TadG [Alphaproteobacteria bacterium]
MASQTIHRAVGRLRKLVSRLRDDRRGNVAMIFGLSLPVIVMLALGGVDLHRITTARSQFQDALDAATLAAARSSETTPAGLKSVALATLHGNLQGTEVEKINDADVSVSMSANNVVIATAQGQVKTLVANIVLPPYGQLLDDSLPISAHSEVNRSSKDVEVALVLDITGSMANNNRIGDLKNAARQLINLVVQPADKQTPYYSKMAIVPYSVGVNMGSYAVGARGPLAQPTNITGAVWAAATGKAISKATRASPGVITANGHGLATDDYVWISNVSGMTNLNDRVFRVTRIDANKVTLRYNNGTGWYPLDTTNYGTYNRGGQIRRCARSDCYITITSQNHGISVGEGLELKGIKGMTALNDKLYEAYEVTQNSFTVPVGGAQYADYISNGTVQCGRDGCAKRIFRDDYYKSLTVFDASNCVSERIGAGAYDDRAPGVGAYVGRNYPAMARSTPRSAGNPCPGPTIQPLTAEIPTLTTLVDSLNVTGSTAGQIGLAWGWYAVSSNFNKLWPSNSAAAYDNTKVLKAVILMTDGEFNTPYCQGVIARDAGGGSGNAYDKIDCDATNGDPFDQAAELCAAIKAQDVIVYTVGFSIESGTDAARILKECASDEDRAYLPQSGADLSADFQAIGREITRLRISR